MTAADLADAIPDAVRAGASTRRAIAARLGVPVAAESFEVAFGRARAYRGVDYAGDDCCPADAVDHGDDCPVVLR